MSYYSMGILVSVLIAFGSVVLGLLIIASGQLFLAIREIALNTRKAEKKGEYRVLESIAVVNNAIGWIIIVGGILVAVMSYFTGSLRWR